MVNNVFKCGDIVVCVNNSGQTSLSNGKKYTIEDFSTYQSHIYIFDNSEQLCAFAIHRFISYKQYNRNKLIESILK